LNGAQNRGTQAHFPVFAAFEPPPAATWQANLSNKPINRRSITTTTMGPFDIATTPSIIVERSAVRSEVIHS
jgi:hypothetical protein